MTRDTAGTDGAVETGQPRIRFMHRHTDRGDAVVDIMWVTFGAVFALVAFVLLVAVQLPFGGGVAHLLFAYSPGWNLGGQRVLASALVGTVALSTYTLRRTYFPLPWYGTAILVTAFAFVVWLDPVTAGPASAAFRMQGYGLAPVFPLMALAVVRYGTPPVGARRRALLWGIICVLCLVLGRGVATLTSLAVFACWGTYVAIRGDEAVPDDVP